jgi:hypothetical protein
MSQLGTEDFERSAQVEEDVWHNHFCVGCGTYWKHHDQACPYEMVAEWPCPICDDSGDPETRERVK